MNDGRDKAAEQTSTRRLPGAAPAFATPPGPHLPNLKAPTRTAVEAPSLSVVIPAYNEEGRIELTLNEVHAYLCREHADFELIVVDDGSSDGTAALVSEFAEKHSGVELVSYSANRGKGHAVRVGMLRARGNLILFCDADLATPIEELVGLNEAMQAGAEIAIGSRAVSGSVLAIRQPWYRIFAGRTLNLLVRCLAVPGVRDTQCGFKLFRRDAGHALFERSLEDGFSFDIEVLYLARRLHYRIAEVPIQWRHREGSKVRLLRDSIRMLGTLARIRLGNGHTLLRSTR